jgi:Toastrack DUF4097
MGMTRLFTTLAAFFALASAASAQQGRGDASFVWSRQMPSGSAIRVQNGDGFIHVSESTTGRVEVRATKGPRTRSAVRDVAFGVEESTDGVTICTLYNGQTSCRDRNRSRRVTSVRADYTVLVPRDIRVSVSTGSGDITVERVDASVTASTGLGHVFISTSRGPVNATSGSGDIDIRLQSTTDADITATSGSGIIRLMLPADFGGEVDAQTANGTLRSDFDISIVGRLETSHVRGTIGRGSSRIRLQTGNGRIELRKS